jgi:hypothetical protein
MNGERCHDANLPFEPSMRRAVGAVIAIIEYATKNCMGYLGRTKPKYSIFSREPRERAPIDPQQSSALSCKKVDHFSCVSSRGQPCVL